MFVFITIYIQSTKKHTTATRFLTSYYKIRYKIKINFFKFFLKGKAGRTGNNASVTVLSKGSRHSRRSTLILLNKTYRCLFLISSIFLNKRKLISLCKYASGSFFILPHIFGTSTGQISCISNLPQRFFLINKVSNIYLIKFLDRLTVFSNIFFNSKPKYSTANGTFCLVQEFFSDYNVVYVVLPSKTLKMVSGWSFVLTGRNSLINTNSLVKSKAGTLKILGFKSKVRGVARNPVDHPHGGRTKTNQPEKSIWGWVAKRNK